MKRTIRKPRGEADPYPVSGRGLIHVCPGCGHPLELYDTRDGDQAYWCHTCQKGHRAGSPPLESLRPEQAS